MPLIEEKYDQHKIDSLKRYLQREAQKGRQKDYEIMIDGFKVVSRTDEVDEFDDYEQEIKDTTRNISILIYDGGNTNRNTRYSFLLNQDRDRDRGKESSQAVNGMGGLGEVDQLIQQRLDEKDREYALKNLTERLEETEEELKEAEKYNDQIEKELAHLKAQIESNKFNLSGLNLVELGSEVLKLTINRNAKKSPLVGQLAGILGALNPPDAPPANAEPEEEEEEASFKKHAPQPQLNERQLLILSSIQKMEQAFNEEQMLLMNLVMETLMYHPDQLITVAQLLNVEI